MFPCGASFYSFHTEESHFQERKKNNAHGENHPPSTTPPKSFSEEDVVLNRGLPTMAGSLRTFSKERPPPPLASSTASPEYDVIFNQDILFKKRSSSAIVSHQVSAGLSKQVRTVDERTNLFLLHGVSRPSRSIVRENTYDCDGSPQCLSLRIEHCLFGGLPSSCLSLI